MLELTAQALLGNDFHAFEPHFHLPHRIETAESKRTLRTRDDLLAVFVQVAADYKRRG
ncbi:hypothetical protein KDD17_10825 [Sulfitobacter albidus]|uniref:Uncharacterized protein n=1 Tax=Sulfitobacter albidus TaxID=2829501 RepID=A0A975JBM9_9RHOB|nr:hypothetical protein [Sulfitobacter albidus]QUJ75466.1 hypothetical protein KDD17_10825 [Sulfitobacter albidus]